MADEKATEFKVIGPKRRIEFRDFALAAFYPRTQSAIPLPANTGATPAVQPLKGPQRDNSNPPANVAKPWKKPWDK
jgi:hypothetical protein